MVHLEAEVEIVLPQTDCFSLLFSQSFLILQFLLASPLPLKDAVQLGRHLDPNTGHVRRDISPPAASAARGELTASTNEGSEEKGGLAN